MKLPLEVETARKGLTDEVLRKELNREPFSCEAMLLFNVWKEQKVGVQLNTGKVKLILSGYSETQLRKAEVALMEMYALSKRFEVHDNHKAFYYNIPDVGLEFAEYLYQHMVNVPRKRVVAPKKVIEDFKGEEYIPRNGASS